MKKRPQQKAQSKQLLTRQFLLKNLPIAEGQIADVKIEATWTTPDGKHHAIVTAEILEDPNFQMNIETGEGSDNAQQAVNNAAEEFVFVEGKHMSVKVDSVWQTPDGKWHASVSLQEQPQDQLKDGEVNPNARDDLSENDIGIAHDDITQAKGEGDDVLELTPDMEEAKDELEDDYNHAAHRDVQGQNNNPEQKPKNDKDGYNSEGLRPPKPDTPDNKA